MARYECNRCKATLFTTDYQNDPANGHLCKDLKSRYERQRKAVTAIVDILRPYLLGFTDDDLPYRMTEEEAEDVALQIVRKISGLNIEDT